MNKRIIQFIYEGENEIEVTTHSHNNIFELNKQAKLVEKQNNVVVTDYEIKDNDGVTMRIVFYFKKK